ncbi:DUF2807 domain-containing protein [Novosphingobium profundi]|uniref:GIN domain-containing protein n=1 Tax=Novosphingobium profundi TaxID=1774954 RepID=UPI001BDB673B|nr:DUF2807 domain-containing protein [Novosphingobium profundi]MBT0668888.1 DUF2807 domain-containing protein [Novosphingobium profundi]
MFRKLLIVFASAAILSIVAFGGAWIVGGKDLRQEFTQNGGWSWDFDEDEGELGPTTTRAFALASGAQIAMEIPVELSFTRGDTPGMTVRGPAKVLDRLVWKDGRLSVDGKLASHRSLKVQITAPEIDSLDLDAPGDVTLVGLDQERFSLSANGAIDLEARGKVRTIFVTAHGAGDIDLGKVEGDDATVRVDGAGDVTLAPRRLADIKINGVGNVTLKRKPQILRSEINGIGSVDHDYTDDKAEPAPQAPASNVM